MLNEIFMLTLLNLLKEKQKITKHNKLLMQIVFNNFFIKQYKYIYIYTSIYKYVSITNGMLCYQNIIERRKLYAKRNRIKYFKY